MKHLNNQDGFVLAVSLIIMSILIVIGTLSIHLSNTEVQIATNSQIHWMEFYGADSAFATGPLWANENILPVDDPSFDADAPLDVPGHTFGNKVSYTVDMTYVDPINNIDWISKMPDIRIQGTGTHPRGGVVKLEQIWVHAPLFDFPGAALRVHSNVHGNGVSGSISGNDASGTECTDVPGIMYDVIDPDGNVDYGGTLTGNPPHEPSGELYPLVLFKDNIVLYADLKLVPDGAGKVEPTDVVTSEADPQVVMITGNTKINNLTGWGMLYVDGTLELAGNLDWHGLILVSGDLTFSGGGNKVIYGSVVSMGDALALNGSVDIHYDCQVLNDLYDEYTKYRPTRTWRYI